MNLATVISLSALIVSLIQAGATWIVSNAPRTRGLRVFSISCLIGGFYAATNVALSLGDYTLSRVSVRFGLFFAALHCVSWYLYMARRDGRPLFRWERGVVAGGVMVAVCGPVPNLLYNTDEHWIHGVPALGIQYIDARSTMLGNLGFAFLAIAMNIQLGRAVRRAIASGWAERAEAAGLGCLIVCGINDALVASDSIVSPYLLDVGFLSLMTFAGAGLAIRFVEQARTLAKTQDELIAHERLAALGEMSAVVAHEVRNPVAIIFNAAASLRKLPGERETLLAIIEEEAERLKRMASDLLDFARPTSTRMMDAPLDAIVESALSALRKGSASDPEVDVEPDLPSVHADVRLLRQAILNLVSNALQAPGRKGRVRVRAERQGEDRVRIEVIDDGEGVSDEVRTNMFQPFFTTRPTGTGLGLAIVRRIAEAHGGMLVHKETPGGGATFAIDVPRERERAGSSKSPPPLRAAS